MGKKSSTTQVNYGNTTTENPYAIASTTNNGTSANFKEGTALESVYNFVNNNIGNLLNDYLTPNLKSATNQAKINTYTNTLNSNAAKSLENNIIAPLSQRNMIRSSQASDLYKNLSKNTTDSLASYINELVAESQTNTANIINNLLKAYIQGYSVISDMQKQSLNTSQGNATKSVNYGDSSNYADSAASAASVLTTFFGA